MPFFHELGQAFIKALSPVLIAGALIGGIAYTAKAIFGQMLSRDLLQFKGKMEAEAAEYKTELDKATMEFRTELDKIAFEHQTKFSTLHETRAEVIAELYKRISEIEHLVFTANLDPNPDNVKDSHKAICDKILELIYYVSRNEIYLPESLSNDLLYYSSCSNQLNNLYDIIHGCGDDDLLLTELLNKEIGKLSKTRQSIKSEFRKMLGVSNETKKPNTTE